MSILHKVNRILCLCLILIFAASKAQSAPQSREQIQLTFAPLVKQTAPAVVNIYTRKLVHDVSPFSSDPIFRQFFGNRFGIPQDRVQRSLGSGVIMRSDGIIVTNNHVIHESDEITVILSDRREFEAKIMGVDEHTDLAILKIDTNGENLPVLAFGDSDSIEVGDLVIAIGNPFGVGQTVTSGIISALARTSVDISDYRSFIQTDAAINPGNSGGALVDMKGHLVGINSAIYSSGGGGSVGIGFAIPAAMVKSVMTAIVNGGKPLRPWLGATDQAVTSEIYQSLRLPKPSGSLINSVHKGGPADLAGLKAGDVIIAVNGHDIDDPAGLKFRLATLTSLSSVQLTFIRNGQEKNVTVHLTLPPEEPARDVTDITGENPFSGATVANLNPALNDELGRAIQDNGVIILKIKAQSYAKNLQFLAGDVILTVNGQEVTNVQKLRSLLKNNTRRWALTIKRGNDVLSVSLGG
jgi:serine protease Do